MITGFPRSGGAVEATAIQNILYEVNSARLFVSFVNGRIYVYENVPAAVHQAFQAALSPDMYFTLNIRDRYLSRAVTSKHGRPPRRAIL